MGSLGKIYRRQLLELRAEGGRDADAGTKCPELGKRLVTVS